MTKLKWVILAILFPLALGYSIHFWRERKVKQDAVLESKIEGLSRKDSSKLAGFDSISKRVDSLTAELWAQSGRIDTVIRKVAVERRVSVPGSTDTVTKVDSVFKDSAFAALSSEAKVELLRLLAEKQSKTCSLLALTCQQARDSAKAVFITKDSLIDLWHKRFDGKPRRRCGIGGTVGVIVGVSSVLQPISGLGVAGGFTCNL